MLNNVANKQAVQCARETYAVASMDIVAPLKVTVEQDVNLEIAIPIQLTLWFVVRLALVFAPEWLYLVPQVLLLLLVHYLYHVQLL
ncbi:hypothetical protein [Brenneria goodwinii]|nr:hypothetical protein [Brenneria goodwinii]